MEGVLAKLRAEIQEGKKMRHDFVLRKFAFLTVLLGGGGLTNQIPATKLGVEFAWLLLLVPVVALAFDFYILTEDYRIKRAGEFIRRRAINVGEDEKEWERFSKDHPNHLSTAAFALVTLIYLSGAAFILNTSANEKAKEILFEWVFFVVFIEVLLVIASIGLRAWLEKTEKQTSA